MSKKTFTCASRYLLADSARPMPRCSVASSLALALSVALVSLACGSDGAAPRHDEDSAGGAGGGADKAEEDRSPIFAAECPQTQGYATEVTAHRFGSGATHGQDRFPDLILGGPEGKGCCGGSVAVVSLGDGGSVTLGFGERTIVDGPGADFIVSENAFEIGGDPENVFAELATVEVSADGETFHQFSCVPGEDESGCAGKAPVFANVRRDPAIDPFDPGSAGGDAFDLSELEIGAARYVRIVDVPGDGAVFDLDAVSIVHGSCE